MALLFVLLTANILHEELEQATDPNTQRKHLRHAEEVYRDLQRQAPLLLLYRDSQCSNAGCSSARGRESSSILSTAGAKSYCPSLALRIGAEQSSSIG
jgi:hypothetical protein